MSEAHPPTNPTERELRWFGAVLLAAFALFGSVAFFGFGSQSAALTLWATGAVLALVHTAVRALRRPLFDLWMVLTRPLGVAVSHALLALVYYGVVTPFGAVMRVFGRDRLGLRFDPEAASYWTDREPEDDPTRYLRQS